MLRGPGVLRPAGARRVSVRGKVAAAAGICAGKRRAASGRVGRRFREEAENNTLVSLKTMYNTRKPLGR